MLSKRKSKKVVFYGKTFFYADFFLPADTGKWFFSAHSFKYPDGACECEQLFIEIEKLTDWAFVYNTSDVEQLGMVTVDFYNAEIEKVLDYCLKGKGLTYQFVNDHIVIRKDTVIQPQGQQRIISGKVIDKVSRGPLPGATVKTKGQVSGLRRILRGNSRLRWELRLGYWLFPLLGMKVLK